MRRPRSAPLRILVEQGISLELSVVPKEKAAKLLERYPRFHLNNFRSWRDYIYEANDLREFPGRHYSGQRNHVNKFRKLYPEAQFRALGKDDLPLIERFWQDYTEVFLKRPRSRPGRSWRLLRQCCA